MKDFFKNIQTLLIVVLLILLFTQRSCLSNGETPQPQTITKIEVRYDTIENVVEKYTPVIKEKIITPLDTLDTITELIDTIEILKDFYSKYLYSDTIYIDTIGYAVISDTITRNIILSRGIQTNLLIPVTTVTNTTYVNKRELYVGLEGNGNLSQINSIGGKFLLKTKDNRIYGLGLGVNQNLQPIVLGGIYWKFGK